MRKLKKFLLVFIFALVNLIFIKTNIVTAAKFVKIIFIGDYQCGKTEVLNTYLDKPFSVTYHTENLYKHEKQLEYEGETYNLILWDTAGEEKYHSLTRNYFRDASIAFIVVDSYQLVQNNIDISSLKHQVERWANEIYYNAPGCKIVLVGTKTDKIDRFDLDRVNKALMNISRIMSESEQMNIPILGSASKEREKLKNDITGAIEALLKEIKNDLPENNIYHNAHIESRVRYKEELQYVKVGEDGCFSSAKYEQRKVQVKDGNYYELVFDE